MLAIANVFEKLFTPTLNGIDVSIWYVFFMSVVLHAGLNDCVQCQKSNSDDKNRNNSKTITPFPKRNINITI